MSAPSFPPAQQAQIIRANQRDLYHVSSLKDQVETVLRAWLGTRWLSRWDKEVDLLVKLGYYGLTTARATQTLGEEYTDIWQYSAFHRIAPPPRLTRAALVLLPTVPTYLLARLDDLVPDYGQPSRFRKMLKSIPSVLEVLAELNLAIFYINGTYYDVVKRLLGIRKVSSVPQNPHVRPPSYSLLGILLGVRLLYRLVVFLRTNLAPESTSVKGKHRVTSNTRETFLDERPVSMFLGPVDPEGEPAKPAEEDERTMLDIPSIPEAFRASRNCTLCLEERTDSCATECGHLFCWSCIVGWGREKAECPLCRQSLSLTRLLPIYNL
ncbi:Pex12 amino terminal region-domain-containing protein [Mycena belliarum]|uniref:RING-type E3 ubiquitin transferase n=1 Tax=Mycena belliarum TaxID=1033014 RepID=A0AAD6UGA5_9AGAR|nr:Pex12 amino terminal region-domain-containing protein [Mycena belliae]